MRVKTRHKDKVYVVEGPPRQTTWDYLNALRTGRNMKPPDGIKTTIRRRREEKPSQRIMSPHPAIIMVPTTAEWPLDEVPTNWIRNWDGKTLPMTCYVIHRRMLKARAKLIDRKGKLNQIRRNKRPQYLFVVPKPQFLAKYFVE